MKKLCPHILVEGTRLTGKTELLRALTACPALVGERKYWYHTPLTSAEWSGLDSRPWGDNMIDFPPDRDSHVRELYDAWLRVMQLSPYDAWFLDRFHLSTMATQAVAHGRTFDLWRIDEALAELNFVVVLCTRDRAGFEAARTERLKVSGKPEQYDDLSVFEREQDTLFELCDRSSLPIIEVDVEAGSEENLANQIADAMQDLGTRTLQPE